MPLISIIKSDQHFYEITVQAQTCTVHRVSISPDYLQKLSLGKVNAVTLIEKSFEYLLQREPNTSILRSFDISDIARYFPEFERQISASILHL